MKQALFIVFTLVLGFVGQHYLPWWSIVVIAGLLGFGFKLEARWSFWLGFLAVALLWGGYAAWLDAANEGILSARMGKLFGGLSGFTLVLLTAFIGGVFGGLGAMTGSLGRALWQ